MDTLFKILLNYGADGLAIAALTESFLSSEKCCLSPTEPAPLGPDVLAGII